LAGRIERAAEAVRSEVAIATVEPPLTTVPGPQPAVEGAEIPPLSGIAARQPVSDIDTSDGKKLTARLTEADIEALAFADPATAPSAVSGDAVAAKELATEIGPLTLSDVPADAVQIVVNARDVSVANGTVIEFLNENQIRYDNVLLAPGQHFASQFPYRQETGVKTKPTTVGGPHTGERRSIAGGGGEQEVQANPQGETASTATQVTNVASADAVVNRAQFVVPQKQQLLLARGLTRGQVSSLQSAISKETSNGTQIVGGGWTAAGEQQPGGVDTIRPGDEIEVTVDELVGAGVERTNKTRVGADGTVTMPMVEPIPAAGQTPAELSDAIARRYRDASLIERPTVTVARTQSKSDVAGADDQKSLTRSAIAADNDPATSSASRPATGPTNTRADAKADQPMDVLITFNILPSATPPILPAATTSPATLPVATAPSTVPTTQPVTTAPTTGPSR
jgi:hypothetical protein